MVKNGSTNQFSSDYDKIKIFATYEAENFCEAFKFPSDALSKMISPLNGEAILNMILGNESDNGIKAYKGQHWPWEFDTNGGALFKESNGVIKPIKYVTQNGVELYPLYGLSFPTLENDLKAYNSRFSSSL